MGFENRLPVASFRLSVKPAEFNRQLATGNR